MKRKWTGRKFLTGLLSAAVLLGTLQAPVSAESSAISAEEAAAPEQTAGSISVTVTPDNETGSVVSEEARSEDTTSESQAEAGDAPSSQPSESETSDTQRSEAQPDLPESAVPESNAASSTVLPADSATSSAESVATDAILTAEVGSLTVTALVPAGALPDGSSLVVRPLPTPDLGDEADGERQAVQAANDQDAQTVQNAADGIQAILEESQEVCADAVLYDIHFETPEGAEIEPTANVQITFSYADGLQLADMADGAENVQVVHVADDGQIAEVPAQLVPSGEDSVGQVTFSSDAFSTWAILTAKKSTVSVTVSKVWNDTKDHSGDSVTVHLLRNDSYTGTVITLNAGNGWTDTLSDLDMYDSAGNAYSYSVEEDAVDGYVAAYASTGTAKKSSAKASTTEPQYVWVPATSLEDDTEYIIVTSNASGQNVTGFTATTNAITWTVGAGAKGGDANSIYVTSGEVTTTDGQTYDHYITDDAANSTEGISMRWIANYLFTATAHQVGGPYDWYSLQSKLTGWYAKDTGQGDWARSVETKQDTNATAWHYGLSTSSKRQPKNSGDDAQILFSENDYWPKQNNHTGGDDYAQTFYLYKRMPVDSSSKVTKLAFTITNTPTVEPELSTDITLYKTDSSDQTKFLEGAAFSLYPATVPDGAETSFGQWTRSDTALGESTSGTDGKVTFSSMKEGNYILEETIAPEGYYLPDSDEGRVYVRVVNDGSSLSVKMYRKDGTELSTLKDGDGNAAYFVTDPKSVSVTVEKKWSDSDSKDHSSDSVTVHLLRNGTDTGKKLTLNQSGDWKGTFSNLPAEDSDGNAYSYTVKEDAVKGYTSAISYQNQSTDGTSQSSYVWVPATSLEDDTEYIIVTSNASGQNVTGFTATTNAITWTVGAGAKGGDANSIYVTAGNVTAADGQTYDRYITDDAANSTEGISMRWIANYLFTATAHQVGGPYDWYSLQSKLTGWYAKDTGQGDWAQSVETKQDTNATAWHYGLSTSSKRQPKNSGDDAQILFSENDYWPKQNNHTGGDDYAQTFYLYKRVPVKTESDITGITATITNTPVPDVELTTDLTVLKVDSDDLRKRLSGASFSLFKAVVPDGTESERTSWSEGEQVGTAVSDENGEVTFTSLDEGFYILRETSAPEGYLLPDEPSIYVTISQDGDAFTTTVTKKDGTALDSLHDGDEIRYAVRNRRPSYSQLPNTGGPGTDVFSIGGLTAFLLAFLLFIKKHGRYCGKT